MYNNRALRVRLSKEYFFAKFLLMFDAYREELDVTNKVFSFIMLIISESSSELKKTFNVR